MLKRKSLHQERTDFINKSRGVYHTVRTDMQENYKKFAKVEEAPKNVGNPELERWMRDSERQASEAAQDMHDRALYQTMYTVTDNTAWLAF